MVISADGFRVNSELLAQLDIQLENGFDVKAIGTVLSKVSKIFTDIVRNR